MKKNTRILITDDQEPYRTYFKEVLQEHGFYNIEEASNGLEMLKILENREDYLVLLDLEMPVMNGSEGLDKISERFPNSKVIIVSLHFERVLVEDYVRRGAKGYLPKPEMIGNEIVFVNAVNSVLSGGTFFYEAPNQQKIFSDSQAEIIPHLLQDKTTAEIAESTELSIRQIERQRHNINKAIGVNGKTGFYKYAFSKGLQFLSIKRRDK